jgi:hypothetical protein
MGLRAIVLVLLAACGRVEGTPGDGGVPDAEPFLCQTQGDCDQVSGCGDWNESSGFDGTCDESGEQQQVCNTYACSAAGICVVTDSRVEKQGCTRDQAGVECGAKSCTAFTDCAGFADMCDQTGTKMRTCDVEVCGDGQCMPTTRDDVAECERVTNGLDCGADIVPTTACAWEGDPECDETGHQDATRTQRVCLNGTCEATNVVTNIVLDCPRPTEGNACQAATPVIVDVCYNEGTPAGRCVESITGSRTITPHKCVASTCVLDGANQTVESLACPDRDTDGKVCVQQAGCPPQRPLGSRSRCCAAGVCNMSSYCFDECEP